MDVDGVYEGKERREAIEGERVLRDPVFCEGESVEGERVRW